MRELPPSGVVKPRDLVFAINELMRGRSNAVGTVTLTAGVTSTAVDRQTFNAEAQVFLFPRTANAAAALATTYATITAAGTMTITHANAVSTDRTFGYLVIGG